MPTYKQTQIAAQLILPNRIQAHPPPNKRTMDNLTALLTTTKA
jgi:hypothetical protein